MNYFTCTVTRSSTTVRALVSQLYYILSVQMGAYGFLWVRWGPGTQKHKRNKVKIDKNGQIGYFFALMAGEISPYVMFV